MKLLRMLLQQPWRAGTKPPYPYSHVRADSPLGPAEPHLYNGGAKKGWALALSCISYVTLYKSLNLSGSHVLICEMGVSIPTTS